MPSARCSWCASPHDPEKWNPVSRLREALGTILIVWTNASAGVGRSDKIMRNQKRLDAWQHLRRHRVGAERARPVAKKKCRPATETAPGKLRRTPRHSRFESSARGRSILQAQATPPRHGDARPIDPGRRPGLEQGQVLGGADAMAELDHEGPIRRVEALMLDQALHEVEAICSLARWPARSRSETGSSASSSAGTRGGCGGSGHTARDRIARPCAHSRASIARRNSNPAPISDDLKA